MSKLSFSQTQIVRNLLRIIILVVLGIVVYLGLNWSIRNIVSKKLWLDQKIIFFGLGLFIGALLITIELKFLNKLFGFLDKSLYNLRNALKGNRGEKRVFLRLLEMLGSSYKLYRNFKIPGKRFDIDAIIIGPKGIITFEIKNLSGEYRFVENKVYKISRYLDGNICYCELGERRSPTKEVLRHNEALEEWLMKNDFERIKVRSAIVLVGNLHKTEKIEKPEIYIITSENEIKRYFDNTYEDPRFTPEFCSKLDKLFKK